MLREHNSNSKRNKTAMLLRIALYAMHVIADFAPPIHCNSTPKIPVTAQQRLSNNQLLEILARR